jgi:phosphotransferase family enzyme
MAAITTEARRNRLLRRVDWRFLLADASFVRAACFAEGDLADAVRLIAATVVGPDAPACGDCDLAVAVDPDAATLRRAVAMLRPGGWCYTEWRRAGLRRPSTIRRRLAGAGLHEVECYWPRPDPARRSPDLWYPLGARAALSDILLHRVLEPTRWGTLRFMRRWLRWTLAPPLGLASPIAALARKASAAMQPRAAEGVRGGWPASALGEPPARVSTALVTAGERTISKAVALVYAEPRGPVRAAVKIARTAEAARGLIHEGRVLRRLARDGVVAGVPRLLSVQRRGVATSVAETGLTGTPLLRVLREDNYRSLAVRGSEWLVELAHRTAVTPDRGWRGRLLDRFLSGFRSRFAGLVPVEAFDRAESIISTIAVDVLVCEHRDFSPWNVHIDAAGEIAVLDWESAEVRGLPLLDLIYFLTYLGFELERGRPRDVVAAYRAMIEGRGPVGEVAAECTARYTRALGLDIRLLPALGVLVWMIHARSEHRAMTADSGGPPDAAVLGRSVFLPLWHAALDSCVASTAHVA